MTKEKVSASINDNEEALADIEIAWSMAAFFFRTGKRFGHSCERRARSLQKVHERLEVLRNRYLGGETLALLSAIKDCSEENLPLPSWLAKAFGETMSDFLKPGGATSLDAVFRSPSVPTNTDQKATVEKRKWLQGAELWDQAWAVALADEGLTSFHAVALATLEKHKPPLGIRRVKELIGMVDKNQRELLSKPESTSLESFLEKRRKRKK
jgi:hypothetical protein